MRGLRQIKRGAFLLPTIVTSGNLAAGTLCVVFLLDHGADAAFICALLILAAGCLDVLDGLVARLTRSTSRFGVELDSLADIVSFGVAPGVLAYVYSLEAMGGIGIAACVWYVTCTALRLARFNADSEESGPAFRGLPSPAAASTIASFVILTEHASAISLPIAPFLTPLWAHTEAAPWAAGAVAVLGWLMISNTPYLGVKGFNFRRPRLGLALAVIVFAYVLVSVPGLLFPLCLLYIFLGLAMRFFARMRRVGPAAPGNGDSDSEKY